MTLKEPQKRYASYGLLLRDVDKILAESAPTSVSMPVQKAASGPVANGSNKWLVPLLVGVVIVMAVLLLARRTTKPEAATPAVQARPVEAGTALTVTSATAQTESAPSFTFPAAAYTPAQQPAAPTVQPIAQQPQQPVQQQPQYQPQPQFPPPPMGGPPPGGPGGPGGPPPPPRP